LAGKTERALAETMGLPEMHTGGKKKGGGDEKEGKKRVRRDDWIERNSRRTRTSGHLHGYLMWRCIRTATEFYFETPGGDIRQVLSWT